MPAAMRKASCPNVPQKGYSPRRSGSLPRVEGEQGFLRQLVVITVQKIRNGFPGKHVGADGIPVSKPDDPCGSVLKIEYDLAPFAVAVCPIQVGSGGDPEPNGSGSPPAAGSHLYKPK